jgi:hypothetical protein
MEMPRRQDEPDEPGENDERNHSRFEDLDIIGHARCRCREAVGSRQRGLGYVAHVAVTPAEERMKVVAAAEKRRAASRLCVLRDAPNRRSSA